MVAFCVVKLLATVCSYSSGGSGGIFAPALFMGAMLGGSVGYLDVAVFHHSADSIGAFAVVGMGAVFAGIVRAPMTSILIVFEMTGGYGLVLPLMIANMSAFALARHWRHTPVYDALLAQDGIFLPHAKRNHEADEQAEEAAEEAGI
jgi:CIC family chloride channel protein